MEQALLKGVDPHQLNRATSLEHSTLPSQGLRAGRRGVNSMPARHRPSWDN